MFFAVVMALCGSKMVKMVKNGENFFEVGV